MRYLVVALALLATPGLADDKDVENAIDDVGDCLQQVTRGLPRVAGGDDDDAEALLRHVKCAESELTQLSKDASRDERYMANEDRIEEFVKVHLRNMGALENAIETLARMEAAQQQLDDLPAKCTKLDAQMQAKIEDIAEEVEEGDESAIRKLSGIVADQVEDTLDDAEKAERDLKRLLGTITSVAFKSSREYPQRWNAEIDRALERSAREILDYFERARDAAEDECEHLMRPEKIDYVVAALERTGATLDAADAFIKTGEDWFEGTREIWRRNCLAMENIRFAYCSVDWNDTDKSGGSRAAAASIIVAEQRDMMKMITVMVEEYKEIYPRGQSVAEATGDRQVEQLVRNMNARYRGIEKFLSDKDAAMLGTRSPWIQVWQRYGVEQHKSLGGSSNCDVTERAIPTDSSSRPDCFRVPSCTVVEFKPNNDAEIRKGEGQLKRYKASLDSYYTDLLQDLLKPDDVSFEDVREGRVKPSSSTYGGADVFVDMADGCFDGEDKVAVNTIKPVTYDRCEKAQPICPKPD
ncbi:hypothetical protein ACMU_17310 [Actibacterium mucosum KCTC 23349]|uniref:Tox-REase-9 domain-containing protein n=1 Tax=Actibacterium mucosum KCTC 23349 TaxID=1454373 RepID=A0A037ZEC1_9RHOB|nr:hypothetical protein [Actibacterium mucosum]KAJ54467.1 hypothetical protein ACMU_17310 [Actibacterium mucosum KCTC 23349]